jgi:hypothetical protein
MSPLRHLLFVTGLVLALAPGLRAGTTPADAELDHNLVIELVHHWVVEVGGERFGLIQFDTPMTTVLMGGFDFDLPVPAFAVVAPVLTVPLLAAIGIIMHGRRRRHGFYS